jgi:hypothetical protein
MTTPLVLCAMLFPALVSGPGKPLKVDLNPPLGRSDLLTPDWENWAVTDTEMERTFDGVTVALKSRAPLRGCWYKPNLLGATMASDGMAAVGPLELVITGLAPGRHTLVTYHNWLENSTPGLFSIKVDGALRVGGLRPTTKVRSDTDPTLSYLEFEATNRAVVVTIAPDDPGAGQVVLNGFELDTSDPHAKAIRPSPGDRDEHVDADSGTLDLTWTAPVSAVSHDVYFGHDRAAVESADRSSPLYRGSRTAIGETLSGLSSHDDDYWRVDEVDAAGKVTRGDLWRFRARHLAFPGAEGYGRFARGGRGGRVIEVSNLEDSGPGSFRAAVDAQGPRTIVFRVSGVIGLKSQVVLKNPYLTVAGQTAPGDGICFRGFPVGTATGSHDIIVRHVRIRVGDESGHPYNGSGLGGDHTIMDHCSISWSMDEGLSTRTAGNVTFQRSIIAEALHDSVHRHPHAYAASIGGKVASFHHNLLVHCTGRNWSLAGGLDNAGHYAGYLDLRNNLVYNWRDRTTDGGAKQVNFVNNYYRPGPSTTLFTLMKPDVGGPGDRQMYYIAGNVLEGRPEYDDDNWKGVRPNGDAPLSEIKSDVPFFDAHIRTTSASEARDDVLSDVGANLPRQDPLDRRYLRETRSGGFTYRGSKGHLPGIIDSQSDLGPAPWPEYRTYDVPADSDHDGMPDSWESSHGLTPHSAPGDFADAVADPDGDGYTRLEDYLSELAARGHNASDR